MSIFYLKYVADQAICGQTVAKVVFGLLVSVRLLFPELKSEVVADY